jgi:hypothetical protein
VKSSKRGRTKSAGSNPTISSYPQKKLFEAVHNPLRRMSLARAYARANPSDDGGG